MGFGRLLDQKLREKGITQATLADIVGIPKTTLNSIITRDSSKVDIEEFLKICEVLDCTPEEFYKEYKAGLYVTGEMFTTTERTMVAKYRKLDSYSRSIVDFVLDAEYNRRAEGANADTVPAVEIQMSPLKVSAGGGEWLSGDEALLRARVADTPDARRANLLIEIDGDSMEPEYSDGDVVLIRTDAPVEVGDVGIFVVDGSGFIKRRGEKELISVNPDYPNIPLSIYQRIDCFGKVIGVADVLEILR